MSGHPAERSYDAIVIGAGFSGLYQLHALRDRLGLSVRGLEAAGGVGGTWYWNRYPGARCDSESHSYCFYFSEALLEEWEWSERYPQQPEVLRYLNYVADKLDLKRDIDFDTRVSAASYDGATNRWRVRTERGETLTAKYLIAAVGCLSAANLPDIAGRDRFAGESHHTSRWPEGGVDFAGKRVGLIGTGSTGVQATPVIARSATHLTVFQRTASYSLPARNAPLTEEFKRYCRDHRADIKSVMRLTPNGHPFPIADRSALDCSPEERRAIYQAAWDKGGLQFRALFRDMLSSRAANDTASDFLRQKIRDIVVDPATADKLANIDHGFATKRPIIDSFYFETFNRDNVSLVDLRAEPILEITPAGIRTGAGDYPLDVIVYATGFDAVTGAFLKLNVTGRDGLALADVWHAGPQTYLGLQVAGFPNFFTVTGPGSPSILCNVPVAIEQHVEWITDCIAYMQQQGAERVEPTSEAMQWWGEQVQKAAAASLLSTVKHSWYLGANVPGKPRVFLPYAGGLARYRELCNDITQRNYDGFVFT